MVGQTYMYIRRGATGSLQLRLSGSTAPQKTTIPLTLCAKHTNFFLNGRSDYSEAFLGQCKARSSASNSRSIDWSRSAVRWGWYAVRCSAHCAEHTNSFLDGQSDYSEAFLWQWEARSSRSIEWSRSAVRCSRGWSEANLLFDERADIHIRFIDFQERQVPFFSLRAN